MSNKKYLKKLQKKRRKIDSLSSTTITGRRMDSLSGVTLIKADGSKHAAETAFEGKVG